jgi:hypothetical protein
VYLGCVPALASALAVLRADAIRFYRLRTSGIRRCSVKRRMAREKLLRGRIWWTRPRPSASNFSYGGELILLEMLATRSSATPVGYQAPKLCRMESTRRFIIWIVRNLSARPLRMLISFPRQGRRLGLSKSLRRTVRRGRHRILL